MGLMPEQMDAKQKATLGVAIVAILAGCYLIYANFFSSPSPPPVRQAQAQQAGTSTSPATSEPAGPPHPPNRRAVAK